MLSSLRPPPRFPPQLSLLLGGAGSSRRRAVVVSSRCLCSAAASSSTVPGGPPPTAHRTKVAASSSSWNRRSRRNSTAATVGILEDLPDDDEVLHATAASPSWKVELLHRYGCKPQTAASLRDLLRTGRGELLRRATPQNRDREVVLQILLQVASFLRAELPVRLAHRILDLQQQQVDDRDTFSSLDLRDMAAVREVQQVYRESFDELVDVPPIRTSADEQRFAATLERLYHKHAGVLVQMARGAYQLRQSVREQQKKPQSYKHLVGPLPPSVSLSLAQSSKNGGTVNEETASFENLHQCHDLLDRFYTSRIGMRVLVGQYLALRGELQNLAKTTRQQENRELSLEDLHPTNFVGMICLKTSLLSIIQTAADDAQAICQREYGYAPDVDIQGHLDLTFPFIPAYLHYILLELLKNALRATCDTHGENGSRRKPKRPQQTSSSSLPQVTVVIAGGHQDDEDVCIKIMDEGGGIRRSVMPKIWSYLYTTADPNIQEDCLIGQRDHDQASPIAGLGYGLPIARSYCRYFGGDLDLISMEGYGTDAFVHLKRLGDSKEPLPA